MVPDMRKIVDLQIDFIVENVSTSTEQCHFGDGWGPSKTDPKGQEGLQDCLLDKIQLCAMRSEEDAGQYYDYKWFDFTACLFLNQKATDTITDHMKAFNLTVKY